MHLIDRFKSDLPLLCGHRGDMLHSPENTVASLKTAALAGARLCEIDVQTTADGVYVLMHDQTLERTTNGTGFVHRTTSQDLATLDAGVWFGPQFATERVPTLPETLHLARNLDIGLVIEIKQRRADDAWLDGLVDIIMAAEMADAVAVSSFDHPQLLRLKTLAPAVKTIGIAHHRPSDPVALARSARLDGLVVDYPMFHLTEARALRANGTWVIYAPPKPALFQHAAIHGVDMTEAWDVLLEPKLVDFIVVDDVAWFADKIEKHQVSSGLI